MCHLDLWKCSSPPGLVSELTSRQNYLPAYYLFPFNLRKVMQRSTEYGNSWDRAGKECLHGSMLDSLFVHIHDRFQDFSAVFMKGIRRAWHREVVFDFLWENCKNSMIICTMFYFSHTWSGSLCAVKGEHDLRLILNFLLKYYSYWKNSSVTQVEKKNRMVE